MRLPTSLPVSLAIVGLVSGPALAAELAVSIEIPRLTVAEYHRPYVAIWLEGKSPKSVTNLAIWYDLKLKDGEGAKWLKDMRQWWRVTGRELAMPVDGLSGATRAPGEHAITFAGEAVPLKSLPPGAYDLVIEAAREVGGRELLRVPLQWPPAAPAQAAARGEHELGAVNVALKP